MRIIIVTQIYPGYKEETRQTSPFAIHYFASEWIKQGYEVEVIRLWPSRPFPFSLFMGKQRENYAYSETFIKDKVRIHRIPIKKIPNINYLQKHINYSFSKIRTHINDYNPDIVICHGISPDFFIGCQLAENYNIPTFLTIHKTDLAFLTRKRSLEKFKRYSSKLKGIFFRSNVLRQKFSNIMEKKFKEGNLVLSGIDEKEILDLEKFYKKSERPSLNYTVACNLVESKKVDIIIKAVQKVNEEYKINLKIIGDGPERGKLEKYVIENNLEEFVQFLGVKSRNDVLKFMQESDVFVMVSSPETFGLVYIEAMSKGCLVIGSKGEGIESVISDGVNGFLCEVGNITELSKIIKRCINFSENEKKAMLLETYRTVSGLTTKNCAEQYLNNLKRYID